MSTAQKVPKIPLNQTNLYCYHELQKYSRTSICLYSRQIYQVCLWTVITRAEPIFHSLTVRASYPNSAINQWTSIITQQIFGFFSRVNRTYFLRLFEIQYLSKSISLHILVHESSQWILERWTLKISEKCVQTRQKLQLNLENVQNIISWTFGTVDLSLFKTENG